MAGEILRGPIVVSRFVKNVAQPALAVNLLVTTLAVAAPTLPPGKSSFPDQIVRKPSPAVSQLPAAAARFDLTTLALNPFSPGRTSIPERIVVKPSARASILPSASARVDLATLALNPFVPVSTDRAQPRPQPQQPQLLPSLNATILAPVAAIAPFRQNDWPNPTKRRIRMSAVSVPSYDRTVPQVVPSPFAQSDWPNPVRKRAIQSIENPPVFNRTAVQVAAPFGQDDWPNPIRRSPINERGFVRATPAPLTVPIRGNGFLIAGFATVGGAGTVTGIGTGHGHGHRIIWFNRPGIDHWRE